MCIHSWDQLQYTFFYISNNSNGLLENIVEGILLKGNGVVISNFGEKNAFFVKTGGGPASFCENWGWSPKIYVEKNYNCSRGNL